MSATILASFYRAVRSLWEDTDGVILPYVTVMLVVLVGIAALALDGARYMSAAVATAKGRRRAGDRRRGRTRPPADTRPIAPTTP